MAAALLSSTEQAFERQADRIQGKAGKRGAIRGWHGVRIWFCSGQYPYPAWRSGTQYYPDYGQDYALIGSPKIYAAIHSGAVHPIWPPARQAFLRVLIGAG